MPPRWTPPHPAATGRNARALPLLLLSLAAIAAGNDYCAIDPGADGAMVIPGNWTSIPDDAFRNCTTLVSMTIPNSVTSIGTFAFHGCTSLASVAIPDSVASIGGYAFKYCTSLASVVIPDSVTSIGNRAFDGCTSLASVAIPDSVTSIGDYAFRYCTSLASVAIPDSVTSIGSGAFYGCTSLASLAIPDSVTSIGSGAFQGCGCNQSLFYAGVALINCTQGTSFRRQIYPTAFPPTVSPTTPVPTTSTPTDLPTTSTPTAWPTPAPIAAPTVSPAATCFNLDPAGGAVLRQTIGRTAAMARDEADPTQLAMETCGWRFAAGTMPHRFCPGRPYSVESSSWFLPIDDYSENCTVASSGPGAREPEPMVMVFETNIPRGLVNYTLPASGFCRFRVKFYERRAFVGIDAATLKLAGRTVWTGNDTAATCATVVSGAFQPGDTMTLTEKSILALFWLELVPDSSPECDMVPAEVAAAECCGTCPIIPMSTSTPTPLPTKPPTLLSTSTPTPLPTTPPTTIAASGGKFDGTDGADGDDDGGSSVLIPIIVALVVICLLVGLLVPCRRRRPTGAGTRNELSSWNSNQQLRNDAMVTNPLAVARGWVHSSQGTNTTSCGGKAAPGLVACQEAAIDPNDDAPQHRVATTPAGIYQVAHPPTRFGEPATYSTLSGPWGSTKHACMAAGLAHQAVYDDAYAPPDSSVPQYQGATIPPPGVYQVAHPPSKSSLPAVYSTLSAPAAGLPEQAAVFDGACAPADNSAVYDDAYAPSDNSGGGSAV